MKFTWNNFPGYPLSHYPDFSEIVSGICLYGLTLTLTQRFTNFHEFNFSLECVSLFQRCPEHFNIFYSKAFHHISDSLISVYSVTALSQIISESLNGYFKITTENWSSKIERRLISVDAPYE